MYDNRALVWIFRCSVFVGLLSAVVTVIYLTPVPELQHASCQRPCHELDWPMICRVRLVLDVTTVVSRGRVECPVNSTDCVVGGCAAGAGVRSKVLTANGQLPGPTIQVCEKDILVVDVLNRVAGSGLAVHWRGQSQHDTPYMDGAAPLTQCPISSFSTFQYKFRATEPGTHLWQVLTGNDELDAMFGALIVRQAPKKEPHQELYDEDDQTILISQLPIAGSLNVPLLINGQDGYSQLNLTAARRHRLRVAYAVTSMTCPVTLAVEKHSLLVIAIDGHPVRPVQVQSIRLAPGERVDVVLTADQMPGEYQLSVNSATNCAIRASGSAVLHYQPDHTRQSTTQSLSTHHSLPLKGLSTVDDEDCRRSGDTELVCLHKIESLIKLPPELRADKLDLTLYLPFDFVKPPPRTQFDDVRKVPRLNNLTLTFPPSPLLSQPGAVDPDLICDTETRPARCGQSPLCECLHVVDIPLAAPVELVLIDQGPVTEGDHVFHLHGHSFHVVGSVAATGLQGVHTIKHLDSRNQLFTRNLNNPVVKDTVSVPPGGVVAVRFKADNPGYWLLRAERASQWAEGLGMVLRVGAPDHLPPVPDHFPTCGSWVGPEFFLI